MVHTTIICWFHLNNDGCLVCQVKWGAAKQCDLNHGVSHIVNHGTPWCPVWRENSLFQWQFSILILVYRRVFFGDDHHPVNSDKAHRKIGPHLTHYRTGVSTIGWCHSLVSKMVLSCLIAFLTRLPFTIFSPSFWPCVSALVSKMVGGSLMVEKKK